MCMTDEISFGPRHQCGAPTPTDVEMRLLSAEREVDCIWAADIADEQPVDRPRSFQWKRPVPAIGKIVAHAFALMRRHKAQGLEVTHVVALAPDGTGSIRSNVMPGVLAELVGLADMLQGRL